MNSFIIFQVSILPIGRFNDLKTEPNFRGKKKGLFKNFVYYISDTVMLNFVPKITTTCVYLS